jgi:hypothetical protein
VKTLTVILSTLLFVSAAHASERPEGEPRTACELLSVEEVAAVQGEPFSKATPSTRGARSQCFYQLPSFVNSVSVDVLREGAAAYWEENFSKAAQARRDAARAGKRKKDGPKPVSGVGREAMWTGNRTGSLYVFTGDAVVRVSVGGGGTEAEKIARTKALALSAVNRVGEQREDEQPVMQTATAATTNEY